MRRCIQIAKNGLGTTRPNPMVGAVIVHKDRIIGEGFTSAYGGSHAEVNAVQSVTETHLLAHATLYVTLEPCSHFGKTPPCSDMIIHHKIPNVVIGTIDTHSKVAGRGIEKLTKAGCNVTVGVLEMECKKHHRRFFTFHNKKRPYIILKWAATKDGFIAPTAANERAPVWISNPQSRQLVHKWRAEEHAILVGNNTVLQDNPKLTTRDWAGQHPIRIVIDLSNKIPDDAAILQPDAKTIVFTATQKESSSLLIYETIDTNADVITTICNTLHKHNIQSILIEGGTRTLQSFIDVNMWDEARVFTSNSLLKKGIKSPIFKALAHTTITIQQDTLNTYYND